VQPYLDVCTMDFGGGLRSGYSCCASGPMLTPCGEARRDLSVANSILLGPLTVAEEEFRGVAVQVAFESKF
jgi:hypothetical protein